MKWTTFNLTISNAHLLRGSRPILVDSGPPGSFKKLRENLSSEGIAPKELGAVLLTHGHADHAGTAAELLDEGVGVPEGAVFLTYFKDESFRTWYYVGAGVRISGDDLSATYRFSFTFPGEAQSGRWTLGGVWAVDANRNSTYLLDGDLRDRGFDWSIWLTD